MFINYCNCFWFLTLFNPIKISGYVDESNGLLNLKFVNNYTQL